MPSLKAHRPKAILLKWVLKIHSYIQVAHTKHLLKHSIFDVKKSPLLWDFKTKNVCYNLITIHPHRYVITHIVQVEGDETMKELRCVSGTLRGADDGTVSYTKS